MLYQTLSGLAFVHARGVLHRRLSPFYVLFDPRRGAVKLWGFGKARFLAHGEPTARQARNMTWVSEWETMLAPELLVQRRHQPDSRGDGSGDVYFTQATQAACAARGCAAVLGVPRGLCGRPPVVVAP